MRQSLRRCDWLAVWILWSAWCSLSGWLLSAVGQLDRAGYAVSSILFLIGLVWARGFWTHPVTRPLFLLRSSTYARPGPKIWLALLVLVLAGGLLHHPDNYDYLTYRFPRVLAWTWQHHWYWIDTPNYRQNLSAVGMEWLMTPLFVFFPTDRLFFLINFVAFLFLPGLVFSVFRRMGIRGRIAWWWMWILPTGYCFLLQAASVGNDGFAATYFLAALYYAHRAEKDSPRMLILSILAIALVTGSKASNMPLAAPWLAVLWLRRVPVLASVRPLMLMAACLVGAVCSFVPIAIANIWFTGNYTGDPQNIQQLEIHQPLIGIAGNSLEVAAQNLAPPLWPHPIRWPAEQFLNNALHAGFPRFRLASAPLQKEELAGVGLGVTIFTLLCVGCGLRRRMIRRSGAPNGGALLIASVSLVAWLVFMSKMGGEDDSRLLAVYYIAAIASLLLLFPPDGQVVRHRPWRWTAYMVTVPAFFLLVLNPSRPLLPQRWITAALRACPISDAVVQHLDDNYGLQGGRRDYLGQLRRSIPPTEKVIGWLGGEDDPEVSLWLPFGSRCVVGVYPTTDLAARHIHYVAVSAEVISNDYHLTLAELLEKWSMQVVQTEVVKVKAKVPDEKWYLLQSR